MNFGVLHTHLLKKIYIWWATKCFISFHVLFKSKFISIYNFWRCMPMKIGKVILISKVSPTDAGDFTCFTGFFFYCCGRFYMLGGRAGEIVSRRETPSQCGRVGSPGIIHSTLYNNFNRLCPHVLNWRVYTIELHRHDSEFPVLKIP